MMTYTGKMRGSLIIDGLTWLGIFAAVLALVMGLAALATGKSKIAEATLQLAYLHNEVESCYKNYGADYSGINTQDGVDCGGFMESMLRGTTTPTNPWNGNVTLQVGPNTRSFTSIWNGITGQEDCQKFAQTKYGHWVRLTVNGTLITQTNGNTAKNAVQAACTAGANIINFTS